MATIIDFTPHALEIDELADAASVINPNVSTAPVIRFATANADPNTDLAYADQFISNSPDVLFVAEYAPPQQASLGSLVVFEKYYNATHYEIFRRDYLAQDDSWKRILLIDTNHLSEETLNFMNYINGVLQIPTPQGCYAILDTQLETDRISEYKVKATFYPSSATVNYRRALQSKGYTNVIDTSASTQNVFQLAGSLLGNEDYGWILSMLNPGAYCFGRLAGIDPMSKITGMTYYPTDPALLPKMVAESIYMFGLIPTLQNMLSYTNVIKYEQKFYDDIIASVNESKKSLSYKALNSYLKRDYPSYKGYGDTGFVIPDYPDNTRFNTLNDLTLMFLRLNTFYLGALYTRTSSGGILGNSPLVPSGSKPVTISTRPLTGSFGSNPFKGGVL